MRRSTWLQRVARVAPVPVVALMLGTCAGQESRTVRAGGGAETEATSLPAVPADPHAHHAPADIGADAPLSGHSVYQVTSPWTDQHGTERTLGELRGRPQVIAMVYTHCGSACPRIVGDMKRLEGKHPELEFVLVSIDPDRDTPGRLQEFAEGSRLGDNWTLLRGADDDLLELAAVLGVRYRRINAEEFMHSNVITVLDAEGKVAYRQEALGELDGTMAAVARLLAD